MKNNKILIIGNGQHGKDTVAKIFNELYGMTFTSSSMAAAKIFIYDLLKEMYNYQSLDECFNDRHNHRAEWFQLIDMYNREDPARLAKEILKESDIYVGMRSRREIEACVRQRLFYLIIWVERDGVQLEDASSFNIDKSLAHIAIHNDGSIDDLREKVSAIIEAARAWERFENAVEIIHPKR